MRKCVSGNQLWRDSKHYSVSAYKISSDPHSIMAEVYKNGPVEVAFTVYEVILCGFPYFLVSYFEMKSDISLIPQMLNHLTGQRLRSAGNFRIVK